MRRALIRVVMPLIFCALPFLAAALVAAAIPYQAQKFYAERVRESYLDWLILGLGAGLFAMQMSLAWRALRWRGTGFDERPDRWLGNLAQAAEWFPMLGLIGTVTGILETFATLANNQHSSTNDIIKAYAPAITATGSGLFMALINMLPTWIVLLGRDTILALGGPAKPVPRGGAVVIQHPKRSVTRFFIPLVDVMMLLFSMFMLMPVVEKARVAESEGDGGQKSAAELAQDYEALEREMQRLKQELDEYRNRHKPELDVQKALEELERLRKEKINTLQQRLGIKILEIDPKNGDLVFWDTGNPPRRVLIDSAAVAEDLMRKHKQQTAPRELYYLFLFPRVDSAYPEDRQFETYKRWFKGVAYGIDRPAAPILP